MTTNKGINTT